jgi:hypothetical protein
MTPEQIMQMTAGPAMNAAVAAALGCTVGHTGGPRSRAFCACHNRAHGEPHSSEGAWAIRDYSGNIVIAFELQAEIERRGLAGEYGKQLALRLSPQSYPFEWSNIYGANREEIFAIANASALDRCKAALLVLAGRQEGQQ